VNIIHEDFLDWQRPVLTEQKAHEILSKNPINRDVNFFSFPWSSLIDILAYGDIDKVRQLLNKTEECFNKYDLNNCFTVCQHDKFHEIIPYAQKMGIDTVFASHMVIKGRTTKDFYYHNEFNDQKINGIKIEPIFLWPVNLGKPNQDKDLLYSFVGSYNEEIYVSDIRKKIFIDNHPENTIVIERKGWQFDLDVYHKQVKNKKTSLVQEYINEQKSIFYKDVLTRSRFSLCPSGSGPSSIRFLESLASGAIPVLLADNMMLPKFKGINWDDCTLKIEEKDYNNLRKTLNAITPEEENHLRTKGLEAYKKCSGENFVQNIREHYEPT
jgi:hypothetical protein